MEGLKLYDQKSIAHFLSRRKGESKFGEKVNLLPHLEELGNSGSKYVLFGIPEDIGIRANSGNPGAAKAWEACLSSLLNIQANRYTHPENLLLLGEIACKELMAKAANFDREDPNYLPKLGDLVQELDKRVSELVKKIILAGKVPIIIGGGHNNAYPIIKGAAEATGQALSVLNIDAHTDLRTPDIRHSGNGFSFAEKDNCLGKYRVFGLHQNYTPQYIFELIRSSTNYQFQLFDHLMLKSSNEMITAFKEELELVSHSDFGLELDCDAIKDFPSSAQSPSGFSFNLIRKFVTAASEEENIKYLHICEAAPSASSQIDVGKALSYLITDFIKAT